MVQKYFVEGFQAFIEKVESLSTTNSIFVLFSGSKDPATGESWCPDCVVAQPIIDTALAKAPEDSVFIYVGVGERDYWKNPKCIFRTDTLTKLKSVPTLLKYGSSERLQEGQCAQTDLVEMLFEDA